MLPSSNSFSLEKLTPGLTSVIIPTYNRQFYLRDAINSVIAQKYRPIECIVVDDGSTDETRNVVDSLQPLLDAGLTLKYIYQSNAGSQAARNIGTEVSTGEFIQYLDSDDLLYEGKISNQVEYFNAHPECDAVFGDWEMGEFHSKEKVIAYVTDNLVEQMLGERCIANFAILMRRKLVSKIGEWDILIKRNQEIDFHLRGVLAGGNFQYQPFCCGLWRVHTGERIVNKANLFSAIEFYQKWEAILLKEGIFSPTIQQGIANNYLWFLGEYPNSSYKELTVMLKEMYRLNPQISIFVSKKFIFFKKLIGLTKAMKIWVLRYKQMQRKS